MTKIFFLATILLTFGFANAQCLIYSTNSKYSTGNLVGRIENGLIYSTTSKYSTGTLIGRAEGGGMMCGAAAAFLILF